MGFNSLRLRQAVVGCGQLPCCSPVATLRVASEKALADSHSILWRIRRAALNSRCLDVYDYVLWRLDEQHLGLDDIRRLLLGSISLMPAKISGIQVESKCSKYSNFALVVFIENDMLYVTDVVARSRTAR